MPFWGIEVKPGKSYAYPTGSARTKLRITQASIGTGKSSARSTLQINVGDNKPVILCNLLPNICENFSMELEFQESETVLFSVLGERSVHLAGYHINTLHSKFDGNDSDSTGEDIGHSASSGSDDDCSDLDRYESDFIDDDDDDDDDVTNSPLLKYTSKERKEPSCWNAASRRLKKTYQVGDYNDYKPFNGTKTASIFDLESDDSYDSIPLSSIQKKKKENEKKKSNAKVSLNADNSRVVVVDAEETTHASESSPSKETKVGQKSIEKTEKKRRKKKKGKEERGIVAVSPSGVEEDGSTADKKAHDETDKRNDANKQKETSDKDGTGVEENQKEEASEHDESGKKKKAKKQKETGAVDSTDNIDDKHHVSEAVHSNNDGGGKKRRKAKSKVETTTEPMMSENALVAKATTDSEVSVVPTDTSQRNAIKGSKKGKKRSKDVRPCDSKVAYVDHLDAKKPKKEDAINEDMM